MNEKTKNILTTVLLVMMIWALKIISALIFQGLISRVYLKFFEGVYENSLFLLIIDRIVGILFWIAPFCFLMKVNPVKQMKNFRPKQLIWVIVFPAFVFLSLKSYILCLNLPVIADGLAQVFSAGIDFVTPDSFQYSVSLWGKGALVFAPIAEELFYRVLLGTFIYRRTKSPVLMLILPSVLFMMGHAQYHLLMLIFIVKGIVYAYVFYKTGNMLIPVLCHSCANVFVRFVLRPFNNYINNFRETLLFEYFYAADPSALYIIRCSLFTLVILAALFFIFRDVIKNKDKNPYFSEQVLIE